MHFANGRFRHRSQAPRRLGSGEGMPTSRSRQSVRRDPVADSGRLDRRDEFHGRTNFRGAGKRKNIAPERWRESNSPAEDEWVKKQARAEHAIACQLRDKALALKARRFTDYATQTWHAMLLENDEARQLLAEAQRHNRRAAQLDPAWESVAHAALEPYFLHQQLFGGDNRPSWPESRVNDFERFLATFPNSPHHQEVLAWCILECIAIGNPRENYQPLTADNAIAAWIQPQSL
jgi:hypothetical protein